jgi:type IV pilus assembly protein PilP
MNREKNIHITRLGVALLPFALIACTGESEREVKAWMNEVKQETHASIPKLIEPKEFIPFTYDKKSVLDPFNIGKLQSALAKLKPGSAHGVSPDLDRRKEALEAYPLDTLKMVGTITKGSTNYALIEADNKGIYEVKPGNYMGQDFGLVTKVNDDSVDIKEIYLDSGGDWAERTQKLELQEAKK